jgi:Leucine-rich repeat (LRR) protein
VHVLKNYFLSPHSLTPALQHGRVSLISALLCAVMVIAAVWWVTPVESYGASGEQYYRGFTYGVINNEVHIWDYAGSCDANSKDVVTLPKSSKLTEVSLHESGSVTSLNFNSCKELEKLFLDVESLKKLTLNQCAKLKNIYISCNSMRSLNLNKCAALREVEILGSDMTRLNLGKKRHLKELDVSGNKLKRLSIFGCTALESINFADNKKLSVNISKNRELKTLVYTPKSAGWKGMVITNPLKTYPKVHRYVNM